MTAKYNVVPKKTSRQIRRVIARFTPGKELKQVLAGITFGKLG